MSAIDEHLATLEPERRAALEHVRDVVARTVPEAVQGRSYGMPAFKYDGRPLIGLLATKKHLSVFPFSPEVLDQVRDRLDGFSLSKGTIRFNVGHPIPDDVIVDLLRLRLAELEG